MESALFSDWNGLLGVNKGGSHAVGVSRQAAYLPPPPPLRGAAEASFAPGPWEAQQLCWLEFDVTHLGHVQRQKYL